MNRSRTGLYMLKTVLFSLLVLGSGCAKKTTVVLLPDLDGTVGQVSVTNDAGSVNMREAGESTVVSGQDSPPSSPEIMEEQEIQGDFSKAMDMLPAPPDRFLLFFKIETAKLTEASISSFPEILSSIERKSSESVAVIGHTDTSGSTLYNLGLSAKRADKVKKLLQNRGIGSQFIEASYEGESKPLIKTGDEVYEPRNRRVEVIVR